LPVRIRFDEMPKNALPRSSSARFSEQWQKSVGDDGFLENVVERWRTAGISVGDQGHQLAAFAEAMGISSSDDGHAPPAHAPQPAQSQLAQRMAMREPAEAGHYRQPETPTAG